MNENEMIEKLDALLINLDQAGCNILSARRFFEVGEWLICLEAVEEAFNTEFSFSDQQQQDLSDLRLYFNS